MLVNVVDVPPLCNFILPAIVRSGPLAIAISTAGASPALAKRMKREIAEQFGEPYARLAVILNDARGWAKATLPTYQDRKAVLRGDRQRRPRPVELVREGREREVLELIEAAKELTAPPWLRVNPLYITSGRDPVALDRRRTATATRKCHLCGARSSSAGAARSATTDS